MDQYIGEWCLYPWFESHGIEHIHPEDLSAFRDLKPNGRLFANLGIDGDYMVLQHAEKLFRVKPSLAKFVPAPAFSYGAAVRVINGDEIRLAVVREIIWHFQRNEPFFLLEVEGKASSRRFWSSELEAQ